MAIQVSEGKNLQYVSMDFGAISTDFRYLSDIQEFIYQRWMFHYMNHGELPVLKLKRIARVSPDLADDATVDKAVESLKAEDFFAESDGQLIHKIWQGAVSKAKDALVKQISGGQLGAQRRYPVSGRPDSAHS